MTTFQTNRNIVVALRRETAFGVATATGASQVRLIGSTGLELKRATVQAAELRADGTTPMGRIAAKSVEGSFDAELTVGGFTDVLLESLMRTTWTTATTIGFASVTTIAIGSNTLTANAGDLIAGQGIRVGDIFTITGTTNAADNNLRLPVIALGTLTITTIPGALSTLTATATGTLTITKRLVTATTITRYSHAIEQEDVDLDLSELFLGCRLTGMKLSCQPGAMAKATFTFMGVDRTALTTATTPYYTSPTVTTGLGLIADDASIVYNGAVVSQFTGIDLDFKIGAKGQAVLGTFVSPDIFDNILGITGTITGLRSDFSNLTLYDAETEFSINLLLKELMAAPVNFLNFFLPRVKIQSLAAPVGGSDGPKIETLGLMIGPKVAATGYDATVAVISSSAP